MWIPWSQGTITTRSWITMEGALFNLYDIGIKWGSTYVIMTHGNSEWKWLLFVGIESLLRYQGLWVLHNVRLSKPSCITITKYATCTYIFHIYWRIKLPTSNQHWRGPLTLLNHTPTSSQCKLLIVLRTYSIPLHKPKHKSTNYDDSSHSIGWWLATSSYESNKQIWSTWQQLLESCIVAPHVHLLHFQSSTYSSVNLNFIPIILIDT